ncbi:hypothetical protein CGRA01v4_05547 [Colletotrichum graminicola]|nr:hypothetical protein CGRA01v4_05547 [Colletotrichum graminicola]
MRPLRRRSRQLIRTHPSRPFSSKGLDRRPVWTRVSARTRRRPSCQIAPPVTAEQLQGNTT